MNPQTASLFDDALPHPAAAARPPLAPPAAPVEACDPDRIGFEIGWDHAHYRLTPPLAHLHEASPVRQGWAAGRAVFGARTLKPTAHVRKWLQLRLNAWQRGRAFEGLQVTPAFLARIDTDRCPITRSPLSRATGTGSDASVDRVNNDAGYAAGNLAVMSTAANQAKSDLRWADALAVVRRIEDGKLAQVDGLGAADWARLGVLMSFATPLPHAVAACLPLLVLPTPRLRVLNPVQALQVLLTLQFTDAGYARRLMTLAALMPDSQARQAFQVFMHTLLARRLAAGHLEGGRAVREALEDTWADPLVNRRWQRLALRLTPECCEKLLQRAARRGLAPTACRWLPLEAATEGWGLDLGGYLPYVRPDAVTAPTATLPPASRPQGLPAPCRPT